RTGRGWQGSPTASHLEASAGLPGSAITAIPGLPDDADRIPVAQLLRQGIHPSAGIVHPALGLGLFASSALRLQVAFECALDERAPPDAGQPSLGVDGLEEISLEEHIDPSHSGLPAVCHVDASKCSCQASLRV